MLFSILLLLLASVQKSFFYPLDGWQERTQRLLSNEDELDDDFTQKQRLDCPIVILGAGIGGSHSAYRLAPIYKDHLCIFERNNYVGGRTYDLDHNGKSPDAYVDEPVVPLGGGHFTGDQPVVEKLANELNLTYYEYHHRTSLIKARGKLYTNVHQMCSESYANLTCAEDSDSSNPPTVLWNKLLDAFDELKYRVHDYGDLDAFSRAIIGDEATEYLKDSYRYNSDFQNTNTYAYLEYLRQDWLLKGNLLYLKHGMSQFAKRMMYIATKVNDARLYLNEDVLKIDDNVDQNHGYVFTIETSGYHIRAKKLIAAMDPVGWQHIRGSVAHDIKSDIHFQSILPAKTIVIQCHWSSRWWEDSATFADHITRVWTKQNCISFIEIIPQHPEERHHNLTVLYDDGLCVDMWSSLMARPTTKNLIEELLTGLRSIFIGVEIEPPEKIFTHIWPGAWHYQISNSNLNNKQIARWALNPIKRLTKLQLSLVGEAFFLDRATWIDAALKSSLVSLTSQLDFNDICYDNDPTVPSGSFCSSLSTWDMA